MVKFSQKSEYHIIFFKKFPIFILTHSGPFSPLIKKRNGHREDPRAGKDLHKSMNHLTSASFHSATIVLENIYSFRRSLNNNIFDKTWPREAPRIGSI